ncbi:hypothetical protein [Lactococcus cremoris]|uniref:Uncharacterized protein n=1 Tax=Lactococcus lactis subsp. cremoris TaxID=1359 RepID=A0AAX4ALE8_LACLC|nr:hypothetical protein [Lactococcus cremoris]WMX71965.1 hypothetical protein RF668_11960 [Lactococcus cremoris]
MEVGQLNKDIERLISMLVSLLFIAGKSVLITKVLTDSLILLTSCSIGCFP